MDIMVVFKESFITVEILHVIEFIIVKEFILFVNLSAILVIED